MTPAQKIMREILLDAAANDDYDPPQELTATNIDSAYFAFQEDDVHWDYESEFRGSGIETDIECDWSRHYESKSLAKKLRDGSWVGWTYWYGGGKYGEPESVDWIEYAYDLECVETREVVTVRKFSKLEQQVEKGEE